MSIVEQARSIRKQTEAVAQEATDETALQSIDLFPKWEDFIGKAVAEKFRVQYKGLLYECVQGHAPQDDWTPDATPALWKRVSLDEWPEWLQPAGGHNAYAKDAKVTHSGKKWTSDTDGNVWEPGVAMWSEVI